MVNGHAFSLRGGGGFVITLGMKKFAWTLIAFLLLAACQTEPPPVVGELSPIQVRVVSWDHNVGQFRLAFALLDGPDAAEGVTAVSLTFTEIDSTEAAWVGTAVSYDDYEIPYWSIYPTIEQPGFYGAEATLTQADGTAINTNFIIEVEADAASVAIGDTAPASQNKTVATEPDLSKISSGIDPDPALYQQTVADALQTSQPTVVGFITPGFCQTKWCAPVLDSVETVRQQNVDEANFIHIEVFDDFQELTYAPQMAEWGLGTQEPWVYVVDADGKVSAKFAGPLSPRELAGALEPLTNE